MTETENNPIYDRNTLEFVTVALEYCSFVESTMQYSFYAFADKAIKILPLLYLKAALLPPVVESEEVEPEQFVTEEMYESVREKIAVLLGEKDTYLETFHPDMQYSDTPIAAFISESLADVYQDNANFVGVFRQGHEPTMLEAIALCRMNFENYWGQQLLNGLKALHAIRFDADNDPETMSENEE
ncbi:DUF5063 domain-containing protein [Parabacteroides sp. PF5-9]|uniref:DUF5063 domain-containing protein n=1 Tax=Parabacteroides sp. PF5-9 TaxID=1742404 RepID=UPI0024747A77|nr:DUF5063 domain-containing protein [Parabacteroides sp. PF5-9]MDH6358676.1 hypothetical protein [Parabacteroides sp. PF5-9]